MSDDLLRSAYVIVHGDDRVVHALVYHVLSAGTIDTNGANICQLRISGRVPQGYTALLPPRDTALIRCNYITSDVITRAIPPQRYLWDELLPTLLPGSLVEDFKGRYDEYAAIYIRRRRAAERAAQLGLFDKE